MLDIIMDKKTKDYILKNRNSIIIENVRTGCG